MTKQHYEEEKKDLQGIFKQLLARGIVIWAIYALLIVLCILSLKEQPLWMGILLGVLGVVLLLATANLVLSYLYLKKDMEAVAQGDFQTCLHWAIRMRKMSLGRSKEIYYGDEARAYILLNDFPHAQEAFAHVHNLLVLEAFSSNRIFLLLHEGHEEEAKAAYLSYALHHRNGKSYSERNLVRLLDGIFHHLEGTPLSPEEEDLVSTSEIPYVQELMAMERKSPAKPLSNEAVQQAALSEQTLLKKSIQTNEEQVGAGGHRYGPYLTLLFVLCLALPILFFLLAIVLGSKAQDADPTKESTCLMWILALVIPFPLASLVLAYLARKKEPHDHYVKNLVIGYIQLPLCVLLSFLSIAPASEHDYSYLSAISQQTGLSFPEAGHLRHFPTPAGVTPDLKGETLVVFDEGTGYDAFVTSFTASGSFWVPWDNSYKDLAISDAYYTSSGAHPYDYVSFYNATDETRNTVPSASGSYHIWEAAHVKDKSWVWIYEYIYRAD